VYIIFAAPLSVLCSMIVFHDLLTITAVKISLSWYYFKEKK